MDPAQENLNGGTSSGSNSPSSQTVQSSPATHSNAHAAENTAPVSTSEQRPSLLPEGWRSLLVYLVITLSIALIVRFYIATPYIVQGASMEPAFDNYHYLIIDRVSYRFSPPQRGDVVVFTMPHDKGRALIKRIIGLPGETVVLDGTSPTVTIINNENPGGVTLDEPYIDPVHYGGASDMEVKLRDNEYFVLGDNRRVSADSRLWGYLPAENIVGKVMIRLYPLQGVGFTPGEVRLDDQF